MINRPHCVETTSGRVTRKQEPERNGGPVGLKFLLVDYTPVEDTVTFEGPSLQS